METLKKYQFRKKISTTKVYDLDCKRVLTNMRDYNEKNYYELLTGKVIPYIDIDLKIDHAYFKKNELKITKLIIQSIDNTIKYFELNQDYKNYVIYSSKSHGFIFDKNDNKIFKASFHFMIRGVGFFNNGEDIKNYFVDKINDNLTLLFKSYDFKIECDKSVYKGTGKNQLFRCIGNYKETDKEDYERYLKPFIIEDNKIVIQSLNSKLFEQHLISNINGEDEIDLDSIKLILGFERQGEESENSDNNNSQNVDDDNSENDDSDNSDNNSENDDSDDNSENEDSDEIKQLNKNISKLQKKYGKPDNINDKYENIMAHCIYVFGELHPDNVYDQNKKVIPPQITDKIEKKIPYTLLYFGSTSSNSKGESDCAICGYTHSKNNAYIRIYKTSRTAYYCCMKRYYEHKPYKARIYGYGKPVTMKNEELDELSKYINHKDDDYIVRVEDYENKKTSKLNNDLTVENSNNENKSIDDDLKNVANVYDTKDDYLYVDFLNEHRKRKFKSYNEMMNSLNKNVPRVLVKIMKGNCFYIKKTNLKEDIFDNFKSIVENDFEMTYKVPQGTENKFVEKTYKFSKYLRDYIKVYSNVLCEPDIKKVKKNEFNLWMPLEVELNHEEEDDEKYTPEFLNDALNTMLHFIKVVWANNDDQNYKYIMSWLKTLLNAKNGITKKALLCISKQGCGKNTLVDFIKKFIIGNRSIYETVGIEGVTRNFNSILQGKRLVILNELASTSEQFRANFDKIKTFITDDTILIEPKNVDPYNVNNVSNYILFSNHVDSVYIEQSDRRYAIFEMNEIYMNNEEYFTNFRSKCFNHAFGKYFYNYIMNFENISLNNIPLTGIRKTIMELSKPSYRKYLDFVKDNLDNDEIKMFGDETKINATIFYKKYVEWCEDNRERVILNTTKFGIMINTYIEKIRSNGYKYKIDTIKLE